VNNATSTSRQALKENKTSYHCNNFLIYIFFPSQKMQKSPASPNAMAHSTDIDCVASQRSDNHKTPARAYTLQYCGKAGCLAVFVYVDGTDWLTVNRLIDDHYPVRTERPHGLI
jgi:hypothetical protein